MFVLSILASLILSLVFGWLTFGSIISRPGFLIHFGFLASSATFLVLLLGAILRHVQSFFHDDIGHSGQSAHAKSTHPRRSHSRPTSVTLQKHADRDEDDQNSTDRADAHHDYQSSRRSR